MIGTSLSVEAAPPVKPNAARGTLLGIAGQGWQMVTAFVLYAFLARQLGPSQFGHWRVVLSVLIWFELFVGAGLVKVATKAIAASPGDRPRIARATYLGQALVAVVVFVALVGLADPIAALLGVPSLGPLLRISSLDIPLYALYMVAASILQGTHRFDRQAVALMVYATA